MQYINNLKHEGHTIVGYVRKSPGSETNETRIRLWQTMIERLKNRSSVNEVFGSPCSKASEPLEERDKKKNGYVMSKLDLAGTTQGNR